MSKKRIVTLFSYLFAAYLMVGCQATPSDNAQSAGKSVYDQNSWKEIIPASCKSFFDGCNNCQRSPGSEIAACTRKYCEHYAKPVCLDKDSGESK